MSHGTRRVIFYIFVVLFFVLGTTIVLYSQGWRFDFMKDSFQRIGGIYLSSTPVNADITLNGKPVNNQSDLLNTGTLISDLIPGTYKVALSYPGYQAWNKEIAVVSGQATVFGRIILLPSTGSEELAPSADRFILAEGEPITLNEGVISFQNHVLPGANLIAVSYGTKVITSNKAGTIYYMTDVSNISSSLNITALFSYIRSSQLDLNNKVTINEIAFHPFDDSRVIINASDGLYVMDTSALTIERITTEPVSDFTTSYDNLFWATNAGIWSYNLVLNSSTTIATFSAGEPITPIKILESGSLTSILDSSGNLYLFTQSSSTPILVGRNVAISVFSPDSQSIAFGNSSGSLSVYNIGDGSYTNLKTSGTNAITNLEWYSDDAHLITIQDNDLYFTAVESGTPVNSDLISNDVSQFSYYPNDNTVYYLTPSGLFSLAITPRN